MIFYELKDIDKMVYQFIHFKIIIKFDQYNFILNQMNETKDPIGDILKYKLTV